MMLKDVPQDYGMAGEQREVCYAVDENGRYVLAPSLGWEPKTVTNHQAWDLICREVDRTLKKIRDGRLSPLAYHMASHQMNVRLLAQYVGISAWRVRRHLKPSVFRKLKAGVRERYAEVFDISVEALDRLPAGLPSSETRKSA